MSEFVFASASPADTYLLGRTFGKLVSRRVTIGISGALGSGKTYLVRAVADGLQIPDPRIVTSPTFVLIQEYPARLPIYHFDVYRLGSAIEFAELGADEYFDSEAVCLVEWSDRVEEFLPSNRIDVVMSHTGNRTRRIECASIGVGYDDLLDEWHQSVLLNSTHTEEQND